MLYNITWHMLYNMFCSEHMSYNITWHMLYNITWHMLYNITWHMLYKITWHMLYNTFCSEHMSHNITWHMLYNMFCSEHMSYNITWHMLYLSNRPHFLWVYRRDNPRGMLGEHEKKLVNHSPSARDLQAFRVFSQHPKWVITPVNP